MKLVHLRNLKVFRMAYCQNLRLSKTDETHKLCEQFVRAVK